MSKKTKKKFKEIIFGPYLLKEADADDVREFRRLYLQAMKDKPTLFVDSYDDLRVADNSYWLGMINDSLEDSRSLICLVQAEDKLVGMVMVKGNDYSKFSHVANLLPLYIVSSHNTPDLQTKVLHSVFEHLKKHSDVGKLQTFVTTSQPDYIAFYNYMGFIRYGYDERHFKVGKKYYDSILLAKNL